MGGANSNIVQFIHDMTGIRENAAPHEKEDSTPAFSHCILEPASALLVEKTKTRQQTFSGK
jgi:isopentenyldiphosphate isomerase